MFRIQSECQVLSLNDLCPSLLSGRDVVDIDNIEKTDIQMMIEYLCIEWLPDDFAGFYHPFHI